MDGKIANCHYYEHACCNDANSEVDCYAEDFEYFSHHVIDSKEAEKCRWFRFCDVFPKF